MGVYDQAARFAAQADPDAVPQRLVTGKGVSWRFRDWLDTRAIPLPGGADRTADLVAALDDQEAPQQPWLMVLEFQAQVDPDKLDVPLEEVAILRNRARHGAERTDKYKVIPGLVYLKGICPDEVLDMTLADNLGTRHAPLIWNLGKDSAAATLDAVMNGQRSWGMLFWVPLMAEGAEVGVIARWKDVVAATVPDRRQRGNLAGVALVFAELVGRVPEWKRGLEGFEMTESQVVNEWISQGEAKGKLNERRQNLLLILDERFPGKAPADVVRLIKEQDSLDVLNEWFRAALRASTFEQFMAALKR